MIQRNQDDFAAARKTLEETVKEAGDLKGADHLASAAQQTLKEMTDPAAYYLPRAERKIAEGQLKPAVDDLNAGLKVLPSDSRLLLKRAEVELQAALAQGKVDEAAQKAIREDAEAARKDAALAAESYYVVGRLEEHIGDLAKAESDYREALKLGGQGAQGDRYRIALARVLQRERANNEPLPEPAPQEDASQDDAPADADTAFAADDLDQGDDAAAAKRLEESINLAKDLIQSPDAKARGEGYVLLGAAQARQGKKTEGLKNFVKGLELLYPGTATQDLSKIIESHPAFSQVDVAVQINPVQAERHFGKGLEYFWNKNYTEAEEQFKTAVSLFDQDARYRYFLGLARYLQNTPQKKTQAGFDFEQGAHLEGARQPSTREINASLERIQGQLRRVLNSYREKAAG